MGIATSLFDYFVQRIRIHRYRLLPQCRTNPSTRRTTLTTTSRPAVLRPPHQLQSPKRSRSPLEARRLLCTESHSSIKHKHPSQNERKQLHRLLRNESRYGMKRSVDVRSVLCMKAARNMLNM